ncbi:protein PHOSPHATE-INDUCED 1-like [Wolffia australiana]
MSKSSPVKIILENQTLYEACSLGKTLTSTQLQELAAKGEWHRVVNVVLTTEDMAMEGFCMTRCASQCSGHYAWPFDQPAYNLQVVPNNDITVNGMVITLSSLMTATFTDPFGNGFDQGPVDASLDVASACPGIYSKNAYPGYMGDFLIDQATGASYNANGLGGRRNLLPTLVHPSTATCSTLV